MSGTGIKRILTGIMAAEVAIMLFYSCKREQEPVIIDFQHTPTQEIRDMEMVQSENGYVEMRMTAPLMQHFEYDADSLHRVYDFYPDSFYVRIYTRDGALETEIISEQARHETTAGKNTWSAFGNVQMINHIRRQRMESDTIYWDQAQHKIYTDCYVRLISEQGEMQGYGMESDEKVRDAYIRKPFDSYSVIEKDSTKIVIDTLNFIGPQMQRFTEK